jgi:hypothetical protein
MTQVPGFLGHPTRPPGLTAVEDNSLLTAWMSGYGGVRTTGTGCVAGIRVPVGQAKVRVRGLNRLRPWLDFLCTPAGRRPGIDASSLSA